MSDAFTDAIAALRKENAAGQDALDAAARAHRKELAELEQQQRAAHVYACTRPIDLDEIPAQVAVARQGVAQLTYAVGLDAVDTERLSTIGMILDQVSAAAERYAAECAELDTTGLWRMATEGRYRVVYRESDGKMFRFANPKRARIVLSDLARGMMTFETARRLEALDKAQAAA